LKWNKPPEWRIEEIDYLNDAVFWHSGREDNRELRFDYFCPKLFHGGSGRYQAGGSRCITQMLSARLFGAGFSNQSNQG
jgi:hypothetical protein